MVTVSAHRKRSLPRNQLLAAMSASDFASLRPHLKPLAMAVFKDMEQPKRRIDTVYFLEAGIASVVASQLDGTKVEVGLIGREGMSGITVVLGGSKAPNATYMQVAGEGQCILAKELRKAMGASESLRGLLLKFVQVFMVQTTQTAVANACAPINQRLARWILMAHDRIDNDTIPLTHEVLALMLGVRRPGVTEALQGLKRRELIDTSRNRILVRNRKGIQQIARGSYGVPEREYRRLIGKD